jgi:hypothetical protein
MNYEKMKLADLKSMAEEFEIPTNTTKELIIKNLKLVEQDKYILPTTCEKYGKDEYLIGVDIKNQMKLNACGKFVDNGEMKKSHMYGSGRIYFISYFKYLG